MYGSYGKGHDAVSHIYNHFKFTAVRPSSTRIGINSSRNKPKEMPTCPSCFSDKPVGYIGRATFFCSECLKTFHAE